MRRAVLIGSLLVVCCAGSHGAPRSPIGSDRPAAQPLRFVMAPGEVLVYRRVGDEAQGVPTELHWVEHRDGQFLLGVEDGVARERGQSVMPADLVFPLSDGPWTNGAHHARRTVALGELRLSVDEDLRVEPQMDGTVRVDFRRRTAAIPPEGGLVPLTVQTGEATYDPTAGRYLRISLTETQDAAQGGGRGSAEWVLDPELSRARSTAHPAGDGATPEATAALDQYLAAHGVDEEIATVVTGLSRPDGATPALAFQLHAHPEALWTAVIDHPEAGGRFVGDERVQQDLIGGPGGPVVQLLRARWAETTFARALVARTADEMLRPELRRIAADRGAVGAEARLSLTALDLSNQTRIDPWRPLVAYPARLEAIWTRLASNLSRDLSSLVPVFLGLASVPNAPAAVGEVCRAVMERMGLGESGDDRRVWREWWTAQGATPWADRLAAEARSSTPEQRSRALGLLLRGPDTPAAREALAEALRDDRGRHSSAEQLLAAHALARRGDGRAAPVLVNALDDQGLATSALESLGYLGETTLGFDPSAPPEDQRRRAATARWREWLRRELATR